MASKKIQLYTDRDKTIEASPETSANCVILSDGNDLQKVLDNDLTNPTVVHEETSFKVGVGDIDVSSSVVDGEVGRMVIKGKTYQNILPEPSTHVLTNNKEMFKVNEGLDPNVEIVDGVSKSAILSGNTLVNIDSCYTNNDFISFNNATIDSDGWITITANGNYLNAFPKMNNLIKPSTKYLAIIEVKENTLDGKFMPFTKWGEDTCFTTNFQDMNNSNSWVINAKAKGVFKSFLLTKDDYANANILERSYVDVACTTGSITYRTMLIEYQQGMENWDIPFFRGMQSVKMPVLSTTGKNLLPPVSNTWYPCRFKQGTTFKLSTKDSVPSNGGNVVFKDINGTSVWFGIDSGNTTSTKVLPCDVYYIMNSLATGVEHQLEIGTQVTSYEPNKTNILHAPEEVVLRKVNGVEDTLNLNTGEYVQRTKEIVLNGSENWGLNKSLGDGSFYQFVVNIVQAKKVTQQLVVCDKLVSAPNESINNRIWIYDGTTMVIHSSCRNVDEMKTWLQQNPLTVQYELATPIVKTVDLSSSGNWEKIVYNGKQNWYVNSTWSSGDILACHTDTVENKLIGGMAYGSSLQGMNYNEGCVVNNVALKECIKYDSGSAVLYILIKKSKLPSPDANGLKQYLSQNPETIWYQTITSQANSIKEMLSFSNGHIQLSSGADNSLIPTLDYQVKTSNSYVMDLMKANTRYTMKAKSASGTFTIDGTSYGAGTNGTFTTPSSMTNKFLVMSNKTNEEVMILEGDVTDKTIPYFKGIKSAFENEDKIEVLSTGKNLYSHGDSAFTPERDGWYFINGDRETLFGDKVHKDCGQGAWFYLEGGRYYFNVVGNDNVKTLQVVGEKERLYGSGATIPKGWYALRMRVQNANQEVSITNVMVEKDTETNYEPYKSNSTKIPLLSPLRSLPNGVCDELIIDRMKKKATLIQRIKSTVFNGSEGWSLNGYSHDKLVEFVCHGSVQMAHAVFSDRFATGGENVERVAFGGGSIYIRILKTKVSNVDSFKKWLSQNPLTVQCGLQTPLITEIDLENFPLVYKDGHIFLNSEIAPVVEIDYSINQSQQIQSNNETLQRHELDILDLDNLIVSFVNAEYNLRLLKFDMELSMMALAE